MKQILRLSILGIAAASMLAATPAAAQRGRGGDQGEAYRQYNAGTLISSREIEARIVPHMQGMSYLGFEFDETRAVYRLKFMQGRKVIWIDVDGRTGKIIGRSG